MNKTPTTVTTIRAVPDLLNKLDIYADKLGLTRNALIIKILWDYIETQESKQSQQA